MMSPEWPSITISLPTALSWKSRLYPNKHIKTLPVSTYYKLQSRTYFRYLSQPQPTLAPFTYNATRAVLLKCHTLGSKQQKNFIFLLLWGLGQIRLRCQQGSFHSEASSSWLVCGHYLTLCSYSIFFMCVWEESEQDWARVWETESALMSLLL